MVEGMLKAAWRYRGFVVSSVVNDFRGRLARSRIGTAWLVLQPLAQALIFATVLSSVLASKLEGIDNRYAYAVYLLSGILCWSLFSEVMTRCLTVFIDNGALLKKMQFPRISLPFIVIGSALVNNLALLLVLMVLLPILGFIPNIYWLWIPMLILVTVALGTGLGLLLGTLNVFARDIGQVMGVVLQFWFWVTPIVYPLNIVPGEFKATLVFNPVASLVMSYHDVMVFGRAPATALWFPVGAALVLLALALVVFRRASAEMVDAL